MESGGYWDPEFAERDHLIRAVSQARRVGDSHCSVEHLLLAVAQASPPSAAGQTLAELGVTEEPLETPVDPTVGDGSIASTPAYHRVIGMAGGLALRDGRTKISDEDVLIAIAYSYPEHLVDLGADPGVVIDTMQTRGVQAPAPRPLAPEKMEWGPAVYFPGHESGSVNEMLVGRYPPGTVVWAFNTSDWRPGEHYVVAEGHVPLVELVRATIGDPEAVTTVAYEVAAAAEQSARAATPPT